MATPIYRIFSWLRKHPRAGWTILLLYAAMVTFPHEQVQALVGNAGKLMGRANLYRWAGAIGVASAAAVTAVLLPELRSRKQRRLIGAYLAGTFLLIFAAWSLLTANNTELAHYPQYFVPGAILMAMTLSSVESLAWIIIVGGLDEGYQYSVLHAGWGVPFDFNDVTMDFLGGALGVVFAMAFLHSEAAARRTPGGFFKTVFSKPGAAALMAILAAGTLLLAWGKMLLYKDEANHFYWFALSRLRPESFWFFDVTWGPKTFHTLSPVEGPILLLLALALYGLLDWKLVFSAPREGE
jgi:hypothetical protein